MFPLAEKNNSFYCTEVKQQYERNTLIHALSTPYAESALAIIRISGEDCLSKLQSFCKSKEDYCSSHGNTIHYGWFVDSQGKRIDEMMISVFKAPRSYTGEESAEITVHGGLAVVRKIKNILSNAGFREALPGEFTFRAFLNGKMDLLKAEAIEEVVRAHTDISRECAVERLSGLLSSEINTIKNKVVHVLASVEIQLDYAEDDDIHEDVLDEETLVSCKNNIKKILDTYSSGKLYQDGIVLAIAGKTNAGKSSIFNLFLKEDRAIVSDIHGTTRDYLESWVDIKGLPVRFIDTAGLRDSVDIIEQIGIKRSHEFIEKADIIMYVVDSSIGVTSRDLEVIESLKNKKHLVVYNKIDINPSIEIPSNVVGLSVKTLTGFKDIENAIFELALENSRSQSGTALIASDRQKKLLDSAYLCLSDTLASYALGNPLDLVSQDLRSALDALGELTGEVTTEDMLDVMFSSFCVGK